MLKIALVALALLAATPVFAQSAAETDQKIDDLLGPHEIYATAVASIQKAVADHDPSALSGYLSYGEPIKVNGEDVTLADEEDLTAQFDELFNDKVVGAVTGQSYETLFVNSDGIMFGDGELWLTGVCDDDACENPFVNIIAINNQ